MYLARLKRYQPTLNFYVTLTEELALKQAAQADAEIKAGKYRGPLHGLPWGAKDLFATKGILTTWGGEPYVEQVFDYDATIVERLREAGAILVAKLTLGALAQGDRWFGGRTNTPWNPMRGLERIVGRTGIGHGRRMRGVRDRHRDARVDHLARDRQRRRRPPADVRTREPVRGDGALEHDGQDRPDDAVRRGRRPGAERDLRAGRPRRHGCRRRVPVESGRAARRVQDRVRAHRVRTGGGCRARRTRRCRAGGGWSAPRWAAPAQRQGGRGGGLTPEQQAERRKMYPDVLDTYRKLGAKLEAVDLPDLSLGNQIGFILEVESAASFDDLTRSGDVDLLASGVSRSTWPNTFKAGRFVPAVEYLRAQRIRTLLMQQMDDVHEQVRHAS